MNTGSSNNLKKYLPFIAGGVVILILILLLSRCGGKDDDSSSSSKEKSSRKKTESTEKGDGKEASGKNSDKTGNSAKDDKMEQNTIYDRLYFKEAANTSQSFEKTGSFSVIIDSDSMYNYRGDESAQAQDLNAYEITFDYSDLGAEHMVSTVINKETNSYEGLSSLGYTISRSEKLDDAILAAMEKGQDKKYFTIAINYDSNTSRDVTTPYFAMIHADSKEALQKKQVRLSTIGFKYQIFHTSYTSKEDVVNHFYKDLLIRYIDSYVNSSDGKTWNGSWDGTYFENDKFEVDEKGIKVKGALMDSDVYTGEMEYVSLGGDPGAVSSYKLKAESTNPESYYDYCNVEKAVWLGGERGCVLIVSAQEVPLEYKEDMINFLTNLKVKDFQVFASAQERQGNVNRSLICNDYILEAAFHGEVHHNSRSGNTAGIYIYDDKILQDNFYFNVRTESGLQAEIRVPVIGRVEDNGYTLAWLEEQRQAGKLIETGDTILYVDLTKQSALDYIVPLPEPMQDEYGNPMEILRFRLTLYNGGYVSDGEEKYKNQLLEAAKLVDFKITGTIGNKEWRNAKKFSFMRTVWILNK